MHSNIGAPRPLRSLPKFRPFLPPQRSCCLCDGCSVAPLTRSLTCPRRLRPGVSSQGCNAVRVLWCGRLSVFLIVVRHRQPRQPAPRWPLAVEPGANVRAEHCRVGPLPGTGEERTAAFWPSIWRRLTRSACSARCPATAATAGWRAPSACSAVIIQQKEGSEQRKTATDYMLVVCVTAIMCSDLWQATGRQLNLT